MSKPERTPIDNLIPSAVAVVATPVEQGLKPFFWKEEVINEILSRRQLQNVLDDLARRYQAWHFEQVVLRDIRSAVGQFLSNRRDHFGIRQFECYNAGDVRRRWMPIRAVTISQLRMILQETRVLERDVHLKGEGYHLALERLERLNGENENVSFGDIYDEVAPLIREFKKHSKELVEVS